MTFYLLVCFSILVLIRSKIVRLQLESAKAAAGLEFSVTGALGFRTIHQVSYEIYFVCYIDSAMLF